jgi:predicted RNA binding protein YcfA (HicA-like mRNA interferase family)
MTLPKQEMTATRRYESLGGVLSKLKVDGWYLVATRGSHRQYKHHAKLGRVTISGKPSDDIAPGTLNSIVKQAGWK